MMSAKKKKKKKNFNKLTKKVGAFEMQVSLSETQILSVPMLVLVGF